jgi:type IV fimbrial biogenesis protein FimT
MKPIPCQPTKGFTILELMVAITVVAILIGLAVPSLTEIIKRNEIAAQNNELIALVHLARNEAIRRNPVGNETVTVEFVRNSVDSTWEGFVRPPGDTETAAGCPTGAIRCSTQSNSRLTVAGWTSGNFVIRFDNRGYSVGGSGEPVTVLLNLAHRNCESDRHARLVRVLPAGQVDSDPTACAEEDPDV